jgi:hypothetical protein
MTDRGETSRLLLPNYNAAGTKDKFLEDEGKTSFCNTGKEEYEEFRLSSSSSSSIIIHNH